MNAEGIANRAVGQYPVSIATSLALESAAGVHPEIVVYQPPMERYSDIWVNVRTLFRNFMGALDKTTVKGVVPAEIAEALHFEIETISSIITDLSKGKCGLIFYLSHYQGLRERYPYALLREDNTELQREYSAIERQTLALLIPHGQVKAQFARELQPNKSTRAMLLTHYAYDLCSHRNFDELVLLESHTGKIKQRPQWYTKYYQGKDLVNVPFREDLLTILGDSETFRPLDNRLRKELVALADKYKWTSVTTYEKIIYSVATIENKVHAQTLKEILTRTSA